MKVRQAARRLVAGQFVEMIEIIPSSDHVAAFRISGTLKAEGYDRMILQIEHKLQEYGEISVFVDMEGFEDMTEILAGATSSSVSTNSANCTASGAWSLQQTSSG